MVGRTLRWSFAAAVVALGLWLWACGSSSSAPSDAGADLGFIPESGNNCPPGTPLLCNGSCVNQDNTHCATCTDTCIAGTSCQAGQCTCADPKQALCNGACIDVSSDPNHCGSCTRTCAAGSACTNGSCPPVQLATATSPFGIATDGKNVYWTNDTTNGSVMSVGVDGGAPQAVAAGQNMPRDLVVQNNTIYWTDDAAGSWQVHSTTAGLPGQVLFSGSGSPRGLTVDSDSDVDWIVQGTGTADVFFTQGGVPLDGATPMPLFTSPDALGGMMSDANNIYWTDGASGTLYIYVVSSMMQLSVSGIAGAGAVAVDTTSVYVLTPTGVVSAPVTGGAPTTILGNLTAPAGITVDDNFVFVTDRGAGNVLELAKGGSTPKVIASGQTNPSNIAFDNYSVYWVNAGASGTIMKTAK